MQRSKEPSDGQLETFAKAISAVTFAPVLSVPAFVVLLVDFAPRALLLLGLVLSLLFGAFLPIGVVVGWSRVRGKELDFPDRETRAAPLAAVAVVYAVGWGVLMASGATFWVVVLMAAYAVNTGLVTLATLRWKVSVHTTGVMGPASLLALVLGLPGALLGLLLPLVAWSRWRLRRHTPAELIAGAGIGLVSTVAQVALSVKLGFPV